MPPFSTSRLMKLRYVCTLLLKEENLMKIGYGSSTTITIRVGVWSIGKWYVKIRTRKFGAYLIVLAGIPMETAVGSETAVYVGVFNKDYADIMGRDPETGPLYQATGNGQSILSNRISYFFDLKGPSVTIDTACSASLVGLHLACQSLRTGEAKQAIVGGTNMIFSPDIMIAMSLLG